MHPFWILPVAATAIIGSCVWWMRRPAVKNRSTRIEPNLDTECGQSTRRRNSKPGTLKAISAEEMRSLAGPDRNYILVDVASDGLSTFAGNASTFVLSITAGELPGVLQWLPADRTVVFSGVSDSARALIEESACMASSKPRCVLSDLPVAMEVL